MSKAIVKNKNQMIKPMLLNKGDKVATISLSWGGAGEILHRYEIGKRQLQETFDVEVIETKNALQSADWVYKNPQARAEDLMEALEDKSVKAILSNIGGDDSIRTLPFIDFETIRNNPKIFMGYSDSTVTHFCFYKAGITSFYGTSLMVGFAENNGMHTYQIEDINKTLFDSNIRGEIKPNIEGWTSERIPWTNPDNQKITRKLEKNLGWRFLQGIGKVSGELLGGCMDVLEVIKDTPLWIEPKEWKGKIMFLETSESKMEPSKFCKILRNYAASGILKNIQGIILGRPYSNQFWKEYDAMLIRVIRDEEGMEDLPIITGMDFGHTCPTFTIPYGVLAEIDSDKESFTILENGVK